MRTAPMRPDRGGVGAMLRQAGDPRLTLGLMPLLAVAVIAVGQDAGPPSSVLAAPLLALAANLAAAIVTRAAFRAQPALLAFHVALLALVVLAAAGRLTYLQGSVELSEGEEFAGALHADERGPLHRDALRGAAFTNLGFTVDYEAGLKRAHTANRVAFRDARGAVRERVIGDDTPLTLAGYRFYTTPNKGFAPEFAWRPAGGGATVRGTVHLPSFPASLARQQADWTPPGAIRPLRVRLEPDESIVALEGRWRLAPPARHAIEIEAPGERVVLRPGDTHRFAEGTLRYAGLRLWMGYAVSHDWTLPWLLASGVMAAAALAWHFAARFRREPWRAARAEATP